MRCTNKNSIGSRCSFWCSEGFFLAGANEIECGLDGHWSAHSPYCVGESHCAFYKKEKNEKRYHNPVIRSSGVRRKFSWGGFIQWHMMVICLWCAVFVKSQFDVIFMFPNQCFGEVCWHNMHIFLHAFPWFYVSLHWILTISARS